MTRITLKNIEIAALVFLALVLVSAGSLAVYSNKTLSAKMADFADKFFVYTEYSEKMIFNNPNYFTYDLTKIVVDINGARLTNHQQKADLISLNPVKIDDQAQVIGFKEEAIKNNGSQITYQISTDYLNWYYYDGRKWSVVGKCTDCTNNAIEINQQISRLPIFSDGLQVRAFLASPDSSVILKSVEFVIKGKAVAGENKEAKKLFFTKASLAHDHDDKVTICHRTGSDTNPYEVIEVDGDAVDGQGHNDHTLHTVDNNHNYGDIIPITDKNGDGNINEADCLFECTDICHEPSKNNGQDLCVASGDVQPHLNHGDTQGKCGSSSNIPNPALTESCGLDIVLVLDSSDSIDNSELQQVKSAANAFVTALSGTPTSFGVVDFDTQIISSLALTNNTTTVQSRINGIGHTSKTELTNWEAGLKQGQSVFSSGSASKPNLMVIITDGDPTTYGYPTAEGSYGGVEPDALDINNAITAANAAKSAGTRILAIGVTSEPTIANLIKISGSNVNSGNLNTDVITTDFNALFASLAAYSQKLCGGTITINKYINSISPSTRGGQGWAYNVDGTNKNTDANGQTEAVEVSVGSNHSVTENSLINGYTFGSVACQKQDGTPVGSATGMSVNNIIVNDQDIISCSFVNNSTCGDAIMVAPEQCDDGNTQSNDGCSSDCQIEAPVCGNNRVEQGEECDDNNTQDGDGCSATCQIELPVCGNGRVETNEQCDDNNTQDGDGCSSTCMFEEVVPVCGNGILEIDEECDDNNTQDGDGCSSTCMFEEVVPVCGNGILEIDEECDDNNTQSGDGCSSACLIEQASPVCGNGLLEQGEQCDDGNINNSDGCSSQCQTEQWDYSNIEASGQCSQANAVLTITNSGEPIISDMDAPSQYRIYRNDVLEQTTEFQLAGGASTDVTIFAGSSTIRLEADQRPGHPTGLPAVVTVESCTEPVAPTARDDIATTLVNNPVVVEVLNNDTDSDGFLNPASATITSDPAHGDVAVNLATGAITYTPETGFYGQDTFSYQVCDNDSMCATATVTVTVQMPPVAVDDLMTTVMNTALDIIVLANDADVDGSLVPSSMSLINNPNNGQAELDLNTGLIKYTPEFGYYGVDSFSYEVCDNDNLCDQANVIVIIQSPPVAIDDSAITKQNISVAIDILDNDSDPDGTLDLASVLIVTPPEHGTVSYDQSTGKVNYMPASDYVGLDSFVYKICDDDGLCSQAAATIGIGATVPPVANDDLTKTRFETAVEINVLINDSDLDGTLVPGSLVITDNPDHGYVNIGSDGNITYTPDNNFSGLDQFVYRICDNDGLCATATVSIVVNTPPVANNDQANTIVNQPVDISILANDTDSDGDLVPSSIMITSAPTNGSVSINYTTGVVTYTPDNDYLGDDQFTYQICDNDNDCDQADVFITMGAPLQPPVAVADAVSTQTNTSVDINVLANDTDADGSFDLDSLTLANPPLHGLAFINNATGLILYTPENGFTGTDTFSYQICDNDNLCDTAEVTVVVQGGSGQSNLPPLATDDQAVTNANNPVQIDIVANDMDPEGNLDLSSILIVTPPTHGILDVDLQTGLVTYTPDNAFSGSDYFIYKICDAEGLCDTARVNITVQGSGTPVTPPAPPVPPTNPPVPPVPPTNPPTEPENPPIIPEAPPLPEVPLIVPLAVLPPPPPLPPVDNTVNIDPGLCAGRLYTSPNITFIGSAGLPPARIISAQYVYTSNNGLSLTGNAAYTASGTGSVLNFTLNDLQTGNYTVVVKVTYDTGGSVSSTACNFGFKENLIFGANQFVLDSSQSKVSTYGIVQFEVDQAQTFYLEAKGASQAWVTNVETKEQYLLTYDPNLKLWTGSIIFNQAGTYHLQATIINDFGDSYTRDINVVTVVEKTEVVTE